MPWHAMFGLDLPTPRRRGKCAHSFGFATALRQIDVPPPSRSLSCPCVELYVSQNKINPMSLSTHMNVCTTRVCDPLPTAWSVRTCHAPQVDKAKTFKKEVEARDTYDFDPVAATPNFCPGTYPSVLPSALFTRARRQGKRRRLDEVSERSKQTQVYNGESVSESSDSMGGGASKAT